MDTNKSESDLTLNVPDIPPLKTESSFNAGLAILTWLNILLTFYVLFVSASTVIYGEVLNFWDLRNTQLEQQGIEGLDNNSEKYKEDHDNYEMNRPYHWLILLLGGAVTVGMLWLNYDNWGGHYNLNVATFWIGGVIIILTLNRSFIDFFAVWSPIVIIFASIEIALTHTKPFQRLLAQEIVFPDKKSLFENE